MDATLDPILRRCQHLESLHALAIELLRLEDYDEMLDALVRHALSSLGADRGFLVLQDRDRWDFKVIRNWSRDDIEPGREPLSRSIVAEVLRSGRPIVIPDALSDGRFSEVQSVRELQIRSVLAAPVEVDGRVAGALYLESQSFDRPFGDAELDLFTQMVDLASRTLASCMQRLVLEQRAALLEKDLLSRYDFRGIVTRDPGFTRVLETVGQVATSDLPVLVQGPSGSGKELIVRAIHINSPRSKRPFLTINCGAISPHLLESELFGHVRGSFTGAISDKIGLLPAADTGSVFLDEIGELPKELQAKLLRTLQFGEVQPVGSSRTHTVDVRFLAATNRDLAQEVRQGRFREDLMYRLNAITIELPPLKNRPADILPLFYHFLGIAAGKAGSPLPEVSPRVERRLQAWHWPGNVRELENEAKRLLALTPVGLPLTADRLSPALAKRSARAAASASSLVEQEKELIELHLRLTAGNRTQAAQRLGISREGLRKKMKRYGLG